MTQDLFSPTVTDRCGGDISCQSNTTEKFPLDSAGFQSQSKNPPAEFFFLPKQVLIQEIFSENAVGLTVSLGVSDTIHGAQKRQWSEWRACGFQVFLQKNMTAQHLADISIVGRLKTLRQLV